MNALKYLPLDQLKQCVSLAREWLADAELGGLTAADTARLTEQQVLRGVERHYDGGLKTFLEDVRHGM